jgi:hypothetical protein
MTCSTRRPLRSKQLSSAFRGRPSPRRAALRPAPLLLVLVAASTAQSASAQLLTFNSRNGQNTAYCGPLGNGPLVHNVFSTPVTTSDSISIAEPGGPNWSPSDASSLLVATPAPAGLSLANSGSVFRGPVLGVGISATADARDEWEFTVSAPVHFSFSASLSATNSSGPMSPQIYSFGGLGGGAQVIPDPGTPPGVFSSAITVPGSMSVTATGTLTPGLYFLSLSGRAEGTNVWPYSGSYSNSISVAFDCGVMTSYCTSGTTTHGCTATIHGNGTPSASATSGFTLDVTGMEGASQGLILYGCERAQRGAVGNELELPVRQVAGAAHGERRAAAEQRALATAR